MELVPDEYDWRRLLGDRLCSVGDFDDATSQYRWCLQRTPYDKVLEKSLTSAEKQRIQHTEESRVADESGMMRR